ncbi:hypothetical protein ULMS_26390 [Patiriisocius marinistellae]|uniref:SnoaL-like domain-containing protein n=1 Tax=Patiriisocius marinistellae TaxID=2494560 RepID=A0A5J4G3X3_9FLAO|nr:nuclear transport factor 2 family protein [Patiriisocius marinistellae]GEQ87131.1 hypothetical protein ULMS_26390 [Patiriisocius marinistellae]
MGCNEKLENNSSIAVSQISEKQNKEAFLKTLETHLNAVTNKDLTTLKSTMSPNGTMQLILPSTEIINGVDGFIDYHDTWFKDASTTWTFETKILNSEISEDLGIAITEVIYREPERNGVPYFNRMTVSYALKKIKGTWYIIKDHASSIEKSTDNKEQS